MLSGIPLEEVISKGFFGRKHGMSTRSVVTAMVMLNIPVHIEGLKRVSSRVLPDSRLSILHWKDSTFTHWRLVWEGTVYDPTYGINPQYPEGTRETSYLDLSYTKEQLR